MAEGRKSTRDKIDAVAQGRVWTGHQALERGLVDEIGGLDRAIQIAKEKAKLDVNRPVNLVIYPQKRSFFELLGDPFGSGSGSSSGLNLLLPRADARAIEATASVLTRYRPGEPLLIMPNVFVR